MGSWSKVVVPAVPRALLPRPTGGQEVTGRDTRSCDFISFLRTDAPIPG